MVEIRPKKGHYSHLQTGFLHSKQNIILSAEDYHLWLCTVTVTSSPIQGQCLLFTHYLHSCHSISVCIVHFFLLCFLDPFVFHCMDKNGLSKILENILCVLQKKVRQVWNDLNYRICIFKGTIPLRQSESEALL